MLFLKKLLRKLKKKKKRKLGRKWRILAQRKRRNAYILRARKFKRKLRQLKNKKKIRR